MSSGQGGGRTFEPPVAKERRQIPRRFRGCHRVAASGNHSGAASAELDPVAENPTVETQFGAPVVRELPPDPGPHERLINVRAVAARLGLSSASVYKLCQRGQLRGLRVGGALRFSPRLIAE